MLPFVKERLFSGTVPAKRDFLAADSCCEDTEKVYTRFMLRFVPAPGAVAQVG